MPSSTSFSLSSALSLGLLGISDDSLVSEELDNFQDDLVDLTKVAYSTLSKFTSKFTHSLVLTSSHFDSDFEAAEFGNTEQTNRTPTTTGNNSMTCAISTNCSSDSNIEPTAGDFEIVDYDEVNQVTPRKDKDKDVHSGVKIVSYSPSISQPDLDESDNKEQDSTTKKRRTQSQSESNEENLLGYRVELKWSSGRWYRGTICEYNELERKHKVLYDDGDRRWYHLPEMVFRFVSEEDEWIDLDDDEADQPTSNNKKNNNDRTQIAV